QENPSSAKGLKKISNEYFKLNQWNNAIETFQTYLKINNKDSNAYFKLAESYYQINNVENAVKNYEQSIENQDKKLPKHIQSTAYYKLGLLNLKNNDQDRSEEHTSELQSRFDLVCRLLLEKKKKKYTPKKIWNG